MEYTKCWTLGKIEIFGHLCKAISETVITPLDEDLVFLLAIDRIYNRVDQASRPIIFVDRQVRVVYLCSTMYEFCYLINVVSAFLAAHERTIDELEGIPSVCVIAPGCPVKHDTVVKASDQSLKSRRRDVRLTSLPRTLLIAKHAL